MSGVLCEDGEPAVRNADRRMRDEHQLYAEMLASGYDYPIRERSLNGVPKPETSIERTCKTCGASFAGSAPGKTGERGIWRDWRWHCSMECDPEANR